MITHYRCLHCGKEHTGTGRLGQASVCACGRRIPAHLSDRAIRFWIVQIAGVYGFAAFFLALAIFHRALPTEPWVRFFSPLLLAPSLVTAIVLYRILARRKRWDAGEEALFNYYKVGMLFFTLGFLAAILAVKLSR